MDGAATATASRKRVRAVAKPTVSIDGHLAGLTLLPLPKSPSREPSTSAVAAYAPLRRRCHATCSREAPDDPLQCCGRDPATHLYPRSRLVRIAPHQVCQDLSVAVLQGELEVSSFHMADVAQHGEKLLFAFHDFGLAGHAR